MRFLDPKPKPLTTAFDEAFKAANRRLNAAQTLGEISFGAAIQACQESAAGARTWVSPRDEALHTPVPFVSLAWWTDGTGHQHVRVHGGRCEAHTPLWNNGASGLPPFWLVFPEFCYFIDTPTESTLIVVCGCGAFGSPDVLDWRGDHCAACAARRDAGQEVPPAAALQFDRGAFTPDGRGMVCHTAPNTVCHVNLTNGVTTPVPLDVKELSGPLLWNPSAPECLCGSDAELYRWNWEAGTCVKVPKTAGVPFPTLFRPDLASPDGRWLLVRGTIHPVDWNRSGNPVNKVTLPPAKERIPYTFVRLVDSQRAVGLLATGQLDVIDPETGKSSVLRPPETFPGVRTDTGSQPRLVDLNWKHDRICLAFSYDDGYFQRDLPPILVGPLTQSGPWIAVTFSDDYLPVDGLLGFSPNCDELWSGQEPNTLTCVPFSQGPRPQLSFALPHHRELVQSVTLSTDGKWLLLVTHNPYAFSQEGEGFVRRIPWTAEARQRLFQSQLLPMARFPKQATAAATAPRPAATEDANAEAPAVIAPCGTRDFCLRFSDFEASAAIFASLGYEGGGYGWHGALDALIRQQRPGLKKKLFFDPEGSELIVTAKTRAPLEEVARLIQSALADPELLKSAITAAHPRLMG